MVCVLVTLDIMELPVKYLFLLERYVHQTLNATMEHATYKLSIAIVTMDGEVLSVNINSHLGFFAQITTMTVVIMVIVIFLLVDVFAAMDILAFHVPYLSRH